MKRKIFIRCSKLMALSLITGASFMTSGYASDADGVSSDQGKIEVHGYLVNGTCLLSMRSKFQEVVLDNSAIGAMKKAGDTGMPTRIAFRLLGCQPVEGFQQSKRSGIKAWSDTQPVITVTFLASSNPEDPSLIQVDNLSGIGLRLMDSQGQQVIPGERGKPQFITTGGNELNYTVIPVRTKAPLIAGKFHAIVNFGMIYD
ncbi:fimbrial protein [Atlantibacter sp. RC6]|uniref:fimbrial protein n=1 Tax=Atlantibacter sp. RC6 TaxID=2587036 RepID=UPI001605F35F|nr:type 1 fimbria pilin [Atlantibacter sp. RC6]